MEQFDRVSAIFSPRRTDDLRDVARESIGRRLAFTAVWVIEDGPYEGQFAMMPHGAGFGWTPECDLDAVEVLGAREDRRTIPADRRHDSWQG